MDKEEKGCDPSGAARPKKSNKKKSNSATSVAESKSEAMEDTATQAQGPKLAAAREKLLALQKMKEDKLMEMRAIKLELEHKKEQMKRETAAMRKTIDEQMSDKLTARVEAELAAAAEEEARQRALDRIAEEEDEEEEGACGGVDFVVPSHSVEVALPENGSVAGEVSDVPLVNGIDHDSTSSADIAPSPSSELSEKERMRQRLKDQMLEKFKRDQAARVEEQEQRERLKESVAAAEDGAERKLLQQRLVDQLRTFASNNEERTAVIGRKMSELETRKAERDAANENMTRRASELTQQLESMMAKYNDMRSKADYRDRKLQVSEKVAESLRERLAASEKRNEEQALIREEKTRLIEETKRKLEEQKALVAMARKRVADEKAKKNGESE